MWIFQEVGSTQKFSTTFGNVCHSIRLCTVEHSTSTVDYSYNFNMIRFQIVDHFLLSVHLYRDAVTSYNVLHNTCNTSDHDPIVLHLNLPIPRFSFFKKQIRVKPAWNRATEGKLTDYSDNLRLNLDSSPLPFNALRCRDVNCRDAGHLAVINAYAEKLSASC